MYNIEYLHKALKYQYILFSTTNVNKCIYEKIIWDEGNYYTIIYNCIYKISFKLWINKTEKKGKVSTLTWECTWWPDTKKNNYKIYVWVSVGKVHINLYSRACSISKFRGNSVLLLLYSLWVKPGIYVVLEEVPWDTSSKARNNKALSCDTGVDEIYRGLDFLVLKTVDAVAYQANQASQT